MCMSMCAEGGEGCLLGQPLRERLLAGSTSCPEPGAAACLVGHLGPTGGPHAKRLIGLL